MTVGEGVQGKGEGRAGAKALRHVFAHSRIPGGSQFGWSTVTRRKVTREV